MYHTLQAEMKTNNPICVVLAKSEMQKKLKSKVTENTFKKAKHHE